MNRNFLHKIKIIDLNGNISSLEDFGILGNIYADSGTGGTTILGGDPLESREPIAGDIDQSPETQPYQYGFGFGKGLILGGNYQVAFGKYNETNEDALFIIGVGDENNRKNAFELTLSDPEKELYQLKIRDGEKMVPIATELYVDNEINKLIDGAPETLNTLKEIADLLTDDAGSGEQSELNIFINKFNNIIDAINEFDNKYAEAQSLEKERQERISADNEIRGGTKEELGESFNVSLKSLDSRVNWLEKGGIGGEGSFDEETFIVEEDPIKLYLKGQKEGWLVAKGENSTEEKSIVDGGCFKVTAIGTDGLSYTLDNIEGLEIGDVVSLKTYYNYINFAKISGFNGNTIIVDKIRRTTHDGEEDQIPYWHLWVAKKPNIGTFKKSDFTKIDPLSDTSEENPKHFSGYAEGDATIAFADWSHAEGSGSIGVGRYSHAEGKGTQAGYASHSEGKETQAIGDQSHAEGYKTISSGDSAHAEGSWTNAQGDQSHAEGSGTFAFATYSHAEGKSTKTDGVSSHAEGQETLTEGSCAHAEGYKTIASGKSSHAEGHWSQSAGIYSHAEGANSIASGGGSHAEGGVESGGAPSNKKTQATGDSAHAEGTATQATAQSSHAEGHYSQATGKYSHAEGVGAEAEGQGSHAEGLETLAQGIYSHAGGSHSQAREPYSFAHGGYVIASAASQAVFGQYNTEERDALFIVGNGTGSVNRNNAFEVFANGEVKVGGRSIGLLTDNLEKRVIRLEEFNGFSDIEETEVTNGQLIGNEDYAPYIDLSSIYATTRFNAEPYTTVTESEAYLTIETTVQDMLSQSIEGSYKYANGTTGNFSSKTDPIYVIIDNSLIHAENNSNIEFSISLEKLEVGEYHLAWEWSEDGNEWIEQSVIPISMSSGIPSTETSNYIKIMICKETKTSIGPGIYQLHKLEDTELATGDYIRFILYRDKRVYSQNQGITKINGFQVLKNNSNLFNLNFGKDVILRNYKNTGKYGGINGIDRISFDDKTLIRHINVKAVNDFFTQQIPENVEVFYIKSGILPFKLVVNANANNNNMIVLDYDQETTLVFGQLDPGINYEAEVWLSTEMQESLNIPDLDLIELLPGETLTFEPSENLTYGIIRVQKG